MRSNLRRSIPTVIVLALLVLVVSSSFLRAEGVVDTRIPFRFCASEKRIDHTPPSRPSLELISIVRGEGGVRVGEHWIENSDAELGTITLDLADVCDDRTPADSLGYQIHLVDGTLPQGLELPDGTYFKEYARHPYLQWIDGASWDQEPFSFRVFLTLLDRAGNESAPSDTIVVAHDGDTSAVRTIRTREARREFPQVTIDWSDDHTETIFFLLGMLDEYLGRRVTEGDDRVESFYPGEMVPAFVFHADLNRLAEEQKLDAGVEIEWGDQGHVTFRSEVLPEVIDSFYDFTFGAYTTLNGMKVRSGWAKLTHDVFEGHGQDAKLAYLAGAYFRYGSNGRYRFSNSSEKARLIARLLEEIGCENVETTSRAGLPASNGVLFEPTQALSDAMSRLPGAWALAAADATVGFVTDEELEIYRDIIHLAQVGVFDGCAMTTPALLYRFIGPAMHPGTIPQPEKWMERAVAHFDSIRTRPASVVALQSQSVIVLDKHPTPGDTSSVWLNRVGFDPRGEGAVVLCGQFSQPPGGCSQVLTVFLNRHNGSWMVTSYSVREERKRWGR